VARDRRDVREGEGDDELENAGDVRPGGEQLDVSNSRPNETRDAAAGPAT